MAEVIWSPAALTDIEQIGEYIARDSPDRAALFVARLIETAERLSRFPHAGRIIPEVDNPSCRKIIYSAYRVMYRIEGERVRINAVIHAARDWRPS